MTTHWMSRVAPDSAAAAALWMCAASAALFWLFSRYRAHKPGYSRWLFVLVLLAGTLIRWVLAWQTPGNYDRESWELAADVFARGGNVYLENARYHYSPLWFWILGVLNAFSQAVPLIAFHVAVRIFLTFVDLGTALTLWYWPRISPWERTRQAAFFYLNPVSFLLTGVHGQFDNLSVFFLVLAVRLALQPVLDDRGHRRAWLWATMAFVTKHLSLFGLITVTTHLFDRARALRRLGFSAAIFLFSFAPYWADAQERITRNVFQYRSYSMPYGLASLEIGFTGAVFAAALAAYCFFLRERRLSTKLLLGSLFFLTFTTGFGVQYLVLPVAFAALRPSRGFFVYTAVAGAYLLGSYFNLGVTAFSWVPLWSVWLTAGAWWASEQFRFSLIHSKAAKTA